MRTHFDQQLADLGRDLTQMGSLCEEILNQAYRALVHNDADARKKISQIDPQIDRMERSIESSCLKLLLQQQPVARDLRQISAALKMITDMERIGDQAEDIGEILAFTEGHNGIECPPIVKMASAASKMVTDSVDAYVRQDLDLARSVMKQDDFVDQCFLEAKKMLISMIREHSADGEYELDLLMIAKYYERIGDHATNIAEWVEFSVTGVHKSEELRSEK